MLKLKLQYFGHLMWRTDSFEKTLMLGRLRAGGDKDDREWDGWMASPTQWTWVWVDSWRRWRRGRPGVLRSMGSQRVSHNWATELNWEILEYRAVWHGVLESMRSRVEQDSATEQEWQEWSKRLRTKCRLQGIGHTGSPRARHPGVWSQVGLKYIVWTEIMEVIECQLSNFKL